MGQFIFLGMVALLVGAMFPLQAAINARVSQEVLSAVWAAAFSGAVLTVVLIAAGILFIRPVPTLSVMKEVPYWGWSAGLCGVVALVGTTALAPRLGIATMMAFIIAGQILCAVVLEHFGGAGLEAKSLDIQRTLAALLIVGAGVLLR